MNRIIINNNSIEMNTDGVFEMHGDCILYDGKLIKDLSQCEEKEINITVNGDCGDITTNGNVVVNGNCGSINAKNKVTCTGDIRGGVVCNGTVILKKIN